MSIYTNLFLANTFVLSLEVLLKIMWNYIILSHCYLS